VVLLILGVAGGIALFFHGFRLNRRRAVWSRHLSDRGRQTVDGIPLWQSKMLRCTERFILPEERVYILGMAQGGNQEESANEARVFIGSHPDGTFIISDRSERDLLLRLRWQVLVLLYGGPALTAACVWGVLHSYVAVLP
jgi:hypothetical protein